MSASREVAHTRRPRDTLNQKKIWDNEKGKHSTQKKLHHNLSGLFTFTCFCKQAQTLPCMASIQTSSVTRTPVYSPTVNLQYPTKWIRLSGLTTFSLQKIPGESDELIKEQVVSRPHCRANNAALRRPALRRRLNAPCIL